ncbi:hypothetical protein [Maritalea myrionectae]|uniref:hypothetical protein n=1 Tax=Maritalea myrionectae TaxID=454601 RepID=UPI0004065889|nr:hypothetical protein [Maritalea myrionectae]
MEIRKLITAITVGAGTVVLLTKAQADARSHLIVKAKGKAVGKGAEKREPYKALQLLNFKAKEELGIEGKLDRHQERACGLAPDSLSDAASADDLEALEKAKAEAEKAKADADKAKAEADAAKAEAQKAKAEADEALATLEAAKAGSGGTSAQTGGQKPENEADAKKGGASNETQNQTS